MARPPGTPNKNKTFLLARLQDMYGKDFHPIIRMAENAVQLQRIADEEDSADVYKQALDGWDKVAAYTEPKLKAVEVKGDPEQPVRIQRVIEFVHPDDQIKDA